MSGAALDVTNGGCDCVERMDAWLAPHNGRLAQAVQVTAQLQLRSRLCLRTEKLNKAKRAPVPEVMASFCPFCGTKAATPTSAEVPA